MDVNEHARAAYAGKTKEVEGKWAATVTSSSIDNRSWAASQPLATPLPLAGGTGQSDLETTSSSTNNTWNPFHAFFSLFGQARQPNAAPEGSDGGHESFYSPPRDFVTSSVILNHHPSRSRHQLNSKIAAQPWKKLAPPLSRRRKGLLLHTDDEGDSRDNSPAKRQKQSKSAGLTPPDDDERFACHFFQRSPKRWRDDGSCTKAYKSINNLKEHLRRHHLLKQYCDRCWTQFESREDFKDHDTALSSANACQSFLRPSNLEGMSERQYLELINRSNFQNASTDVEKWKIIHRLLFPSEQVTSPFWNYGDVDTPHLEQPQSTLPISDFAYNQFNPPPEFDGTFDNPLDQYLGYKYPPFHFSFGEGHV